MRRNTFDAASGTCGCRLHERKRCNKVADHYRALFGDDAALDRLREQYAMQSGVLPNAEDRQALAGLCSGRPGLLRPPR